MAIDYQGSLSRQAISNHGIDHVHIPVAHEEGFQLRHINVTKWYLKGNCFNVPLNEYSGSRVNAWEILFAGPFTEESYRYAYASFHRKPRIFNIPTSSSLA